MRLLATAALSLALAAPAGAQAPKDPPSLWSLLTVERFVGAIMNQMLFYARLAADVRYDTILVDPVGASVQLGGLVVVPKLPHTENDCVIRAARATLQRSALDQVETGHGRITLDRAVVDFDCLPPEARPVLGMMRVTDIEIDRLDLMLTYHYPSGALTAQLQAGVDGIATLLADADLDYMSFRMDFDTEEPDPVAHINALRIQIEDAGALARLEEVLPPQMRDPDTVAAQVRDGLRDALGSATLGGLSPAQAQFIDQAAQAAGAVASGAATRLVVETQISPAPALVGERLAQDPAALFAVLNPRVGTAPSAVATTVSTALLQQALDGDVPDVDRLTVGKALLSGVGAPRNIALALDLLDPLIEDGNAEAARLSAEALLMQDAETAYTLALIAAANGDADALATADKAEGQLDLGTVLAVQDRVLSDDPSADEDLTSIPDMRRAAQDHLIGLGRARSFEAAYFWASAAAAAGDSAAAALRDGLDARMRVRGLSEDWADVTANLDATVLEAWVDGDLPTRLATD